VVIAIAMLAAVLSAPPLAAGPFRAGDSVPPRIQVLGRWWPVWRGTTMPARWPAADADISRGLSWRTIRPGLEYAEAPLAVDGVTPPLNLILVRVDPSLVPLELSANVDSAGAVRPWTLAAAPADAIAAFNGGQFTDAGPWGWVVHRGKERRPPGIGPLSLAVSVDQAGRVAFLPADSMIARRRTGDIREALQSYPALLMEDGQLPDPLRRDGLGLDRLHRDSRLAIGLLRDGRVLVALTRLASLGGIAAAFPVGPTVPETAAIMGALGCARAVMLDGGLSSQLLVRDGYGTEIRWPGLRAVPLGLIVRAAPR
jgi:hypothetical protein